MSDKLDARHNFLRRYGVPAKWRDISLGAIANVVGGGTPSRDESRYWHNGDIPWATPTDLTALQGKLLSTTSECITEAGLNESAATLLPVGSVLYTSRATIGAKAIAAVQVATNQGFASLVPSKVNGEYLYYLLDLLTPIVKRLGAGTTFDEVSKRDLRKVQCAIPSSTDEQAAIALVLNSVDVAIERAREATHAVENLRRSLMQELLPPWIGFRRVELEALPKDVESIELARDVCDVCNGSTPSRTEGRYWRKGSIAWLPTGKVHDRVIRSADEFVTESALRECSITILPRGTVLVGMIGQGRTRGMAAYLDIDACINQNFGAFVPRERVHGKWLFHYFDYHYSRLREVGGGTNQGAMNCFLLKRLRLPLPLMERQLEVARILDSVELLARKTRNKNKCLGELKKSLMHDLLTGTVRVDPALFKGEQ
jgi:type I restriction enzyme S subunit